MLHKQRNGYRVSEDDTVTPFGQYPLNEVVALSELMQSQVEQAYRVDTVQSAKDLNPDQKV